MLLLGVAAPAVAQTLEPAVWPAPRALDAARLERFGIRLVRGEHVTLVTDLPSAVEVDRLPPIANAALPQLADYFSVDPATLDGWRVHAFLIGDRARFDAAGLMPAGSNAEFLHGLSMGYELWVNDQASDYYRRALFLHELTHSFMSTRLGGCGPGWYMEAVAEMMGAHELDPASGEPRLSVLPPSREGAELWGRVRLIRAADAPLPVNAVMRIDNRRVLPNASYAWVWALARFLDSHPRYRERFRELPSIVLRQDFNDRFRRRFAGDWRELNTEFRLFAATLEYGHDIAREAIDFQPGRPLAGGGVRVARVEADRGWQASGVAVRGGDSYAYKSKGEYTISREPDGRPWIADAGGVTITYHGGHPLGRLLASVDAPGGFSAPIPLGVAGTFAAPADGVLYLRVNDSPARLADNAGRLRVAIKRVERIEQGEKGNGERREASQSL